jgi:hypothetical protein
MMSAELGAVEKCWGSGVEGHRWPRSGGRYPTVFDIHLSFLQLSEANHRQEELCFE